MTDVIKHYDNLIEENNDSFRDPEPLKDYMNKWDGHKFVDSMQLSKDKTVLEIGIGTGRIAVKVIPNCKEFCGIDISQKTIDRAKENLAQFDNTKFVCCDFTNYEFDKKFDVIYSSLTSMHFEDKQGFISKVSTLLNGNGRFVLSIDKNQSDYIDMGAYKLKIYPDTPENIINCINASYLHIQEQFETEFANIFVCTK